MGDFGQGNMLARDGKTIINNANAFAQEWQVSTLNPASSDPSFPSASGDLHHAYSQTDHLRRRLAETSRRRAAAEKA
jgi:hypothetical protein